MRNPMPLRWIEEAEERRVLAEARFEPTPRPPWSDIADNAAAQWLPRLGAWLAASHLQPAPIRRPVARPERRRDDGDGCSCDC